MAEDEIKWFYDDPDASTKYPHYEETMAQLEAILQLCELRGVTGPEIASMLASLHARAIALLHPTPQQVEFAVSMFRQAVQTNVIDLATCDSRPG